MTIVVRWSTKFLGVSGKPAGGSALAGSGVAQKCATATFPLMLR